MYVKYTNSYYILYPAMIYCNLLRKLDAEDENFQQKWRIENNEQKKQRQVCRTNTIEDASQVFLQACKESPVVLLSLSHVQANMQLLYFIIQSMKMFHYL